MAEALISLVLEQLTAVLTQQVEEEVNLVRGVEKQADKLESNLKLIRSVLEDAERKQMKEKTVRAWLDKLKDVCYDMDDVLDEWSYAMKTGDAEENIHNQQKIRCSFLRSPCFCLNQVVQRRDIALKIKEVSEKVDEIVNEKAKLNLLEIKATGHEPQQQKRTSTSQVDELNVYGRDDEKKIVVSKLLAESSQDARNVDVISLVGFGGIGKTTLAKLAFNDAEVTAHFEKKMWVCVLEAFNEVRIAKAILEELEGSTPNLIEFQTLLQRVSQSIKGKRFLLVIDDVWTEKYEHWEQLERSLTGGCARGSRILVTTRNANVANMMRTNHQINMDTLSEDACRSIFNHSAFHERDNDECERLTDIGNEIAKKCKGLPLAAKVLGGLMQSKKTREQWEDVLSSEIWGLGELDKIHVEEQILLPLLLSYYDLPFVVRRCFLYCAMFPKDNEMRKDELVKMWMAQGYLKGTASRDMEAVGEQYFQVLAARSFFQDIEKYSFLGDLQFKMHDIVHDFAQYMTENECLTVDDYNLAEAIAKTSIERVRHLSMMLPGETSFPSSIHRAKGLRSLLIDNSGDPWLGAALPDVMKQLTCIRSLNLSWSSIKEIPKEVGKLIHLRHLNLKGCRELVSLPETMCDLCNLQSLDVCMCLYLKELPLAIGKLVNLRHLRVDGSGVAFMPKGIERLTCLRTLDRFILCGGGENESKAASLRELKNLNHIGGSLEIRILRGGIEDAAEAQLKNKKRLLCLELTFDSDSDSDDDILNEVLQPPSDLEKLTIDNYGGTVLPNWMMALTRLQDLELSDCGNLEVLPPLGRLPNLKRLKLKGVGVRRLDAGFLGIEEVENANNINEGEIARVTAFPKLKILWISSLSKLEEWDGIERRVGEEDATTTSIFIMPQLRELFILDCPLLRALPDYVLAASLQELQLNYCLNLEVLPLLGRLHNLESLQLMDVGVRLEVLPPLGRLPNLESLQLRNVGVRRLDAGFLGIEEVENANNINEGEIARVAAFPKLKSFWIWELYELEEWDGIERRVGEEDATTTSIFIMPQLQQLKILECPFLRALPDYVLAAPLQVLYIRACPNLSKRYGKEEKGEDWHKISHIPNVSIHKM